MTTVILHPEGLSDIDLNPTGDATTASYIVDLGSLDLGENERLSITYSEGSGAEGGMAISSHGPLVPVTFRVVINGTGVSASAARTQMLQYVQELEQAVCNADGGTFEYKPEDIGAGVRSTFYHYEQSSPPRLRPRTGNNWDGAMVESAPAYVCTIELEVEVQTQPFATSDPDNPVSVKTATTIYNQDDGQAGHVAIVDTDIKGTIGALTQLRIRNMVSGTWAAIEKLWYARRTEGDLGNFVPVLEGGAPDTDSSIHWGTESNSTRRSNNFQRYAPPQAANDQWASLEYTISNITDHEGKAAIALVCRSLHEQIEGWDIKASLEVADTVVETDIKNVAACGVWTVLILGELDIPPTPVSDDESYATKLKIYLRRTSSDEDAAFDIDFVQLLYVDEYVQQVNIPSGFTSDYKLLLENFDQEICHVIGQATMAFDKVGEPLCELLQLRPGINNRIDFIWERLGRFYEVLVDDFEDYEAWNWLAIEEGDFEDASEWPGFGGGTATADTTNYIEGSQGLHIHNWGGGGDSYGKHTFDTPQDFTAEGRFTDDDFVYVALYVWELDHFTHITVVFVSTAGSSYAEMQVGIGSLVLGWNYLKMKRSDLAETSMDWTNVTEMRVLLSEASGDVADVTYDDLRLVRADPSDATKGNETGAIWDFVRDVWHIEEQASSDKMLGCLDFMAGLEQVALIHEEPSSNIKFLAQVKAKRDDGDVGLIFRCEDGTSGSEDMGAFFIDTANDELELRKWAAGSASDIASAVSQSLAVDTDYWLGVWILDDSTIRCYFGTSEAAIWDSEKKEFVPGALKFNTSDAVFVSGGALEGGQCGLLSIGTLGRFDDVELYGVGGGHVPGDTVQVEVEALFRTIYPFRE